jgi:hypothetical protein
MTLEAPAPPGLEDPWLVSTITVPGERGGPPGMANGGWVSGTVAGHLAGVGGGPVEVTLRAPTPLDTPVTLRVGEGVAELTDGDTLLVSARRSPGVVRAPEPVSWTEARAASARFTGHHEHPFPRCFVCGIERAPGDGLRLFPGAVASGAARLRARSGGPGPGAGRMACVLAPAAAHAGPHGRLSPAAVWAALDCPTAWVNMQPGAVALLGRLRAEVRGTLHPGEEYLVVAESAGTDGRKAYGRAGIYGRDGRLLAASEAIWISVDPRG